MGELLQELSEDMFSLLLAIDAANSARYAEWYKSVIRALKIPKITDNNQTLCHLC